MILIIKMSNQLGSVGSKQLFSHVRDSQSTHVPTRPIKQARKPRSYASPKLRPSDWLTGVRCRATSVAKKYIHGNKIVRSFGARTWSGIDFINKDKGVVCTSGTSTMRKGGGEGRWENCENFWVELWRLGEEMVLVPLVLHLLQSCHYWLTPDTLLWKPSNLATALVW